jgi:HEAT repeat protein/beta-lactamase regulating signal transducer with metallopeptidase domain
MTSIIAWALVHFLWQGALIGAALAVLLALSGRRSPRVRYAVSMAALIAMAAMPAVTVLRLARTPDVAAASAESPPEPRAMDKGGTVPGDAREPSSISEGRSRPPSSGAAEEARSFVPKARLTMQAWVDRATPWLVAIWLVGVLGLSLRLLGGWAWARRLTRIGTRPVTEVCRAMMERLVVRLRVSRPIQLLESTLVQVPAVVGAFRPVLLVPVSAFTGLTPGQLEVLLAHELAHIRRHDYLVNLLQSVVETLLFYHPAVWWVSRRIREEREHCCDDLAVASCGDRALYAGALLELERLRAPDLGLAAAATGGVLVRRIRRLLSPAPSHNDEGPRWLAGVVVVALVVAVGGGATLSKAAPASEALKTGTNVDLVAPQVQASQAKSRRTGPAEPDTVIRHPGSGPLGERVSWAYETARRQRFERFWIGYVLPGDVGRTGWFFFDRHVALELAGGVTLSGHMHMTELGDFRVPGVRLGTLVGERAQRDIAILFGFRVENGRRVLDRVRLSHFVFPVHFDGRALLWLDEADDEESVALIQDLYDRGLADDVREDLVAMVGVHGAVAAAVPALIQWLRSDEAEQVRAEAAEALAWQPDPVALAALARAARADRTSHVRGEAAEAVGDMDLPAAADTLIALARTLEDQHARSEAVEALGVRGEPKALEALAAIAREDPATDIQREAVETLGEIEGGRGVRHLLDILESHPLADVRQEAVETIGEAMSASEALPVLERLARSDPHPEVQREAVETLGELHDERAHGVIESIARTHANADVAREAVETLVESKGSEGTREFLLELARSHPSVEVRREAVETLGELDLPALARDLAELAERSEHLEVQREAVETLGDVHDRDGAALEHLARIARTHPRFEVRQEAIETYGEHAPAARSVELLKAILESAAEPSLRFEVLETLVELPDGAGIPSVIEIARGHPDRQLRLKAIEALGESDDPRARALLDRMLQRPEG